MIAASRGLLRLQESVAGVVSDGFERLTGRPFPRLRPRPLWCEQPLYYKGNTATFTGDGDIARWPAYAQALDYELEIGAVIARDCTDLTPHEALGVVGGFVLVNDFSARDVQFREMVEGLMGPAKSKDFGTALGPIVVTSPEFLPVLGTLDVEVRVNGEVWGAGSTRGMQHSLADVVAYASAGERLAAGTVIGLGTVPGCSGVEAGRWLSPGDVVELSAGPLGTLRNTVGEPEPWRRPGPAARARWSIVVRAGEQADPRADPAPWAPPPARRSRVCWHPIGCSTRGAMGGARRGQTRRRRVRRGRPAVRGCRGRPDLALAGRVPTPARPSCSPTPTAAPWAWRPTHAMAH
jgi:2-keto-4-pentenoate hydratase/2-oxohepta-3-ene-1,7-dioic acid hydratase in catechol pathway